MASVSVNEVGKCYRIYPDSRARLKEALTFGRKSFHTEKWALQDISFELEPGQALGLIGFNGAGKSTLLKILTGTTRNTTGHYSMGGSVSSLLELGAGFHSDFSGKDNIFMNAAIQGIPKAEVKRQYDEIAEFSELGDYLQQPVRTYSSGMAMRLGFSAAMIVDPDILILDEILAVGDIHFQKKCMDKFKEFRDRDKTVLFVSHSVYHIREICDRCIWLHEGKMVMDGDPISVTDEYENRMLELQNQRNVEAAREAEDLERGRAAASASSSSIASKLAAIEDVEMSHGDTVEPCREFVTGDPMTIRVRYRNPETRDGVYLGVVFNRNDGLQVMSSRPKAPLVRAAIENDLVLRIPRLQLLAGEYTGSVYMTDDTGGHIMDQKLFVFRFRVTYGGHEKGVFLSDAWWDADVDGRSEITS